MNIKRLLTLGAIMVLLSGCNIIIRVGEGGTVMYDGGSCGPNQECVIPVTDFLFSNVFTAKPATGYEFIGWRKRSRGLCGGSEAPCELSTQSLPRNNAIRSLLESDDEDFFLVPLFRSTGGSGASGSGNAMACFNPELFSQGTQGILRYRAKVPGEPAFDTDHEFMVVGQTTFNGQQAIEISTRLEEFVEGFLAQVEASTFNIIDEAAKQVKTLGSESMANADGVTVTILTELDPYSLFRYDLDAGESYEDRYTSTTEISSPAFPPGFNQRTQFGVTDSHTFLGQESVTVAAGTYRACKWEMVNRGGGFTTVTTTWMAVDSGVLIKSSGDDGSSLELLPGSTLNGRSL